MITLVLSSVEGFIQIAIGNEETLLYTAQIYSPQKGTEVLMPLIEEGFTHLHLSPKDISRIAVVNGPGSFTAIRLILTTALAISLPYNATLASFTTLEALALCMNIPDKNIWVITKAQKALLYAQSFTTVDTSSATQAFTPIQATSPIYVFSPEDFQKHLEESSEQELSILGSGIELCRNLLESNPYISIVPKAYTIPSLPVLYQYACGRIYTNTPIEPCYMRATDAENNRILLAQKIGYTKEDAERIYSSHT